MKLEKKNKDSVMVSVNQVCNSCILINIATFYVHAEFHRPEQMCDEFYGSKVRVKIGNRHSAPSYKYYIRIYRNCDLVFVWIMVMHTYMLRSVSISDRHFMFILYTVFTN